MPPNSRHEPIIRDEAGPRCTARELSRTRLIVEGNRELYIEPVVFVVSGGRALLAGKPSYIFAKRQPGAMAEVESRHAVFGAVIEADGTARTVSPPPVNDGKVTAVAALASDGGGWRMIFAEQDSIATGSPPIVNAYWHGIYDGTRWSAIERLPSSAGKPLLYFNSSDLTQNGDTIVWAALAQVAGSRQGIVIFEKIAGSWSHHIVSTPFASRVELAHIPGIGFVLAGVHRDTTAASHRSSVFFYPRRSNWELHRKVTPTNNQDLGSAALLFSEGKGTLSWMARTADDADSRWELKAMVGAIADRDESILTVDRDAIPQFVPVALPGGQVAWVTHHSTDSSDSTETGELRLVRLSDGTPEMLWRTAHPYLGPFTATAYATSDVLITGPELDKERELLVSLLIRVRIQCDGSTTPGD